VLLEREEVHQVAVVGSPDKKRGEIVKAFVILEEGYEASREMVERLQDYVKERVAPYKYPREVEFVEELPTTETGKIQRATLRERERDQTDTD
jgi:2-aminobenzoate-CoA ligase